LIQVDPPRGVDPSQVYPP